MMAKKPEDRPQTSREIVREVGRLRMGGELRVANGEGSRDSAVLSPPAPRPSPLIRVRWLLGCRGHSHRGRAWVGGQLSLRASGTRPPRPNGDEPTAARPNPAAEREKELLKLFQEHNKPKTNLDLLAGLKYSLELGMFYVNEDRLDDADQLFGKIAKHKEYGDVGTLGTAMVMAFRGQADQSNEKFKELLTERDKASKDKTRDKTREELHNFWKNYPPWKRKMIALALHHNKVNHPETFPPELEVWLNPPRPTAKAPDAGFLI